MCALIRMLFVVLFCYACCLLCCLLCICLLCVVCTSQAWGLQDHGAEQVKWIESLLARTNLPFPYQLPLTWESAQVLLEFYHPSFLPAVEENKTLTPEVATLTLTSSPLTHTRMQLVSLYQRLVDVIPDTGKGMWEVVAVWVCPLNGLSHLSSSLSGGDC